MSFQDHYSGSSTEIYDLGHYYLWPKSSLINHRYLTPLSTKSTTRRGFKNACKIEPPVFLAPWQEGTVILGPRAGLSGLMRRSPLDSAFPWRFLTPKRKERGLRRGEMNITMASIL